MTEQEEKAAFAALLLKMPNDPFKAALELVSDTTRALRIAMEWPKDPIVKAETERLTEGEGALSFLPGKGELLRDIWDRMQGQVGAAGTIIKPTPDDYAKLAKLYAEVRGFIEKPQSGPAVQVIIPRAIEVPTHGTDEQWESAAATQQRELLDVSRSRH